jgi:Tfp pilus assembly protein PilP
MCNARRNRLHATWLVLLLTLVAATPLLAKEQAKEEPQLSTAGDFSYTSQDRRDPFDPVYLRSAKSRQTANVRKPGYELEELKLVGVVKTGAVKFAMMEDTQGRGLMFKRGDFINKNLWLLDILDDKIVMGYKLRGDTRKIVLDIPRK